MIILFGSYARGNWVEDKYKENGTTYEYKSDYDLLVIVEDEIKGNQHKPTKRLRPKIWRDVNPDTPLNIIYHGIPISIINNKLNTKQSKSWRHFSLQETIVECLLIY